MNLATRAKQREATKPKHDPASTVVGVQEAEATLYRAPQATNEGGFTRAQFRGRTNRAGTVRVRVYAVGKPADLAGEIVERTIETADSITVLPYGDEGQGKAELAYRQAQNEAAKGTKPYSGKDLDLETLSQIVKCEWETDDNTLVVAWFPAVADPKAIRVTLGL